MALPILVKDINSVPEAFRSEYKKQDDGSYLLDTDNNEFKSKVDEFRSNNIRLSAELEEKKKALTAQIEKFKDVDPEKYARSVKALKILESNEEGQLIADGKIDEVLARRTEAMRAEYENQIGSLKKAVGTFQEQATTYGEQLRSLKLESFAATAFDGLASIRPGAKRDVLNRAREVWRLNEKGEPVPMNADGSIIRGKDGSSPLTDKEWAASLVKDASYLFEESGGGGAAGGRRGGGGGESGGTLNNDAISIGQNLEAVARGKKTVIASGGIG